MVMVVGYDAIADFVRSLVLTVMIGENDYISAFMDLAGGESPSVVAHRHKLPKNALMSRFSRLARKVRYRDLMIRRILDDVIPVMYVVVPRVVERVRNGFYRCKLCGMVGSKEAMRPHLMRKHRGLIEEKVQEVIREVEDNLRWWNELRSSPLNVKLVENLLTYGGEVHPATSPGSKDYY